MHEKALRHHESWGKCKIKPRDTSTLLRIAKTEEKLTMPHTDEDPEQLELSYIADGNAVWYIHPGKEYGSFLSS